MMRRPGLLALAFVLAAGACTPDVPTDPDPGLEEGRDDDIVEDAERGAPTDAFGPACVDLLAEVDTDVIDHAASEDVEQALADEPLEQVVQALPALSHLAGALEAPAVADAWPQAPDGVTLFAPVSEAFADRPADERWDDREAVRILDGHLYPAGAELVQDLVHAGDIVTQGGTQVGFSEEGATVTAQADGRTADVICANLRTQDGVLHVIDGLLTIDAEEPEEDVMEREDGWLPPDEGADATP